MPEDAPPDVWRLEEAKASLALDRVCEQVGESWPGPGRAKDKAMLQDWAARLEDAVARVETGSKSGQRGRPASGDLDETTEKRPKAGLEGEARAGACGPELAERLWRWGERIFLEILLEIKRVEPFSLSRKFPGN